MYIIENIKQCVNVLQVFLIGTTVSLNATYYNYIFDVLCDCARHRLLDQ